MTFKPWRSCRETTALVLQGHDRALAWHERASLHLHHAMCSGCRRFARQAALMREAAQRWRTYRDDG